MSCGLSFSGDGSYTEEDGDRGGDANGNLKVPFVSGASRLESGEFVESAPVFGARLACLISLVASSRVDIWGTSLSPFSTMG